MIILYHKSWLRLGGCEYLYNNMQNFNNINCKVLILKKRKKRKEKNISQ